MTLFECTARSLGVKPPFVSQSHRSAASGHCTAKELQAHTALPDGKGEPLFNVVRPFGDACHLCTRPSLHSSCLTQCTLLFEPRVIRSGRPPLSSLASQSHSASRCDAPLLMLGCLVLLRPASRPHWGHPVPFDVLLATVTLHLCLQRPHIHAALMVLNAVTVSGVLSPLASQSHAAATSWQL